MQPGRFKGRTVLVTGGARGIGYATAQLAFSEGAQVVIWDKDGAAEAAQKIAPAALGVEADVTKVDSVAAALDKTLKQFGRVDALVASAGVNGQLGPVKDYPFEEWKRVLDEHANGTFLTCKAVLEPMLQQDYGRIITIASLAGKTGVPNASAYAAAKAAVIAFTKSLGIELSQTNIRANVVAPGPIDTTFLSSLPDQQRQMMQARIPQGRLGTAEECAQLIAFLASENCTFNSGAVFDISGGMAPY
jgi:3-oxoacyl-[acyl-carrier protein] reductase